MNKETLDRIEELQHRESLLFNCIDYLITLWGINEKERVIEKLKKLGFNEKDIEDLEV